MASARGMLFGTCAVDAAFGVVCDCACCCCWRRVCSSCIRGTPTRYCQPNTTIIDSTTASNKLRCSDIETPVGTNEAGRALERDRIPSRRQARRWDDSARDAEAQAKIL